MKENKNKCISQGFYKRGISSSRRLAHLRDLPNSDTRLDFDPDELSWVTPRIAITDWEGALTADGGGDFVICVAEEFRDLGHVYEPVDLTRSQDQVIGTLNRVAKLILWILSNSDKRVVVHSSVGIERSPLAVAWFLKKYSDMTADEAYSAIKAARPIAVYTQNWTE